MKTCALRPQAAIIPALTTLLAAFAGLLLVTWSANWDALNGNAFANQVDAHVHSLP